MLDAAYERGDAGFFALCDLLTAGRDDKKLGEVMLRTYEKIQAHPDPRAFLADVREGLFARGMNTPHGRVLLRQAQAAAAHGAAFLRMAVDEVTGIDELADAYLPALTSDLHQAGRLLDALHGGDWDTCVETARSIKFDRLKAARKFEDKAFLDEIKAMREEWKSVAKVIRDKWLTVTADEAECDRGMTAPALAALCDMVNAFDDAYAAAKRARNAADFNDLEHFAVRLLYDGDKPSALAKTLSAGFAEIAVDEYQDTNAVQDAIFRALSRNETNLFMVGDVKQSIYGFRLADPSIFLSKYRAFADAGSAPDGAPRRVILGQNFRSRAAVLDACNYLFSAVMGETVGDLPYTDREALHLGADYYPDAGDPRYQTEVLLVDAANLGEDDDAPDKTALEARLAAGRIRQLLDEGFPVTDKDTGALRPVTPGDIVILLRSPKLYVYLFIAALEQAGISASAEERGGLLETAEVGTMVSLLSIIDNPRQDVDLIGVMRSPLFGFTEQELADIRLVDRSASYYDALLAARGDFPKAELFLQQLDFLREFACDQPVYRLLWEIYDETGALGLYGALPNGAQRQSNLLAFFERARAFEGQGFRGLFAFVRLLRGMLENGEDFQTVGAEATAARCASCPSTSPRVWSFQLSSWRTAPSSLTKPICASRCSCTRISALAANAVTARAACSMTRSSARRSRCSCAARWSARSCAFCMWRSPARRKSSSSPAPAARCKSHWKNGRSWLLSTRCRNTPWARCARRSRGLSRRCCGTHARARCARHTAFRCPSTARTATRLPCACSGRRTFRSRKRRKCCALQKRIPRNMRSNRIWTIRTPISPTCPAS